jgi:hypothetical protein
MTRTRLAGILLILTLVITGCGTARSAAPAAPPPPAIPGQATSGPDLAGVQLPDFVMPLISGPVSLPRAALTPGAVTTTDATTVCNLAQHASPPSVPSTVTLAIDITYGYTTPIEQNKYNFDFLVPYDLGGAPVTANIWPAAIRGTGFYQKLQTDAILREMVCRRTLTLAQAQHALETNWYAAWLRYVIAAGHI